MFRNGVLYYFICGLLCFAATCISAQNKNSAQPDDYLSNNPAGYLNDRTGKLTIDEILQLDTGAFRYRTGKGHNLKLGSAGNWFRLRLQNEDSIAHEVVVEVTNPFLYAISFYTVDSSGLRDSLFTGSALPFKHREKQHPNFQYEITLPGKSTSYCYINIGVGNATGDLLLHAWKKDKRNELQVEETKYLSYFFIINIAFLGLIGLAIYQTRQRFHWFFFLYAFFGFALIYADTGLGYKNIWPLLPRFNNASVYLIANLQQVFGLLFVQKYFSVAARRPLLNKALSSLIAAGLIFEAASLMIILIIPNLPVWLVYSNTLLYIVSGISVFIVAATSLKFKAIRKDGYWFIIGFAPHAISILALCLRPFGLFNNSNEAWFKAIAPFYIETLHSPNFLLWAVIWEVVIVFWLILRRIKSIYEDHNIIVRQLAVQKEKNMRALLNGIEGERQRIAQELHDGSGVGLSALKMKLNVLKDHLNDKNTAQNNIIELMGEVDKLYQDIRGISHNLMPKTLSKLGLFPAIDELINQFRIAEPNIHFNYFRKVNRNNFSETSKINIYRILQELLTNVVKHSRAKEVSLQLISHTDSLVISVDDDGIGFNTRETSRGLGLTGIASRVEMLNGELSVDSSPQNGTFISITLPLKNL